MVVKMKIIPSAKKLTFHHENPEVFAMSQWQRRPKSWWFFIYRMLFAIFFIGVLIYSLTSSKDLLFWPIYLTNIGLLVCTIYATFAAVLVTFYHFDLNELNSESISYKIFWLLSNISMTIAFVITIVYWVALFDGTTSVLDILVHAMNSVAMFIEICIVLHPIYLYHFVYPVGFGILYAIFSIIYFLAGGVDSSGNPYIYDILDWRNPGQTTILILILVVLAILLHLLFVLIQILRVRMHKFLSTKLGNQKMFVVNV